MYLSSFYVSRILHFYHKHLSSSQFLGKAINGKGVRLAWRTKLRLVERGPQVPEAEADAEGDEDAPHDVGMEDGTEVQLGDSEPMNGLQTSSKGKDKALADSQPEEPEAEADGHDEYPYQQPAQPYWGAIIRRIVDARAPIDLTPRASTSRSPAPSDVQHTSVASRNGSRAQLHLGVVHHFLAAARPSVLASSLSGEIVEDQGPSVLLTSRIDGVKFITEDPPRRTRSPYIKWTKEEDDLLAKAVAKYGQKWDLVQKELPSRGYHQVRRWVRKLGVFDGGKLDLASRCGVFEWIYGHM
ncbi:hypothetical protein BU17DRAFT_64014 [Hysterangium stoloniferum]|nr:hypothetical protein BU17DRAFT_64014 [Hysterangium stoloniferum]